MILIGGIMNDRKINVVHILEATAGGTRKHLLDIAMNLDLHRFNLTIICSTLRDPRFLEDIELLDKRNINLNIKIIQMTREIRPLADLIAFLKVFRYLRRHPFDILHAHSSKAGFLGRLAGVLCGVPLNIYSPHCFYFQQKKGLKRSFFLFLERFAGRFTDHFVAVSEGERTLALQEGISSPQKITAIANGIDLSRFECRRQSAGSKAKLGLAADSFVVGTISRITGQKGYVHFFRTASILSRRHPNCRFLFIGGEKNRIIAEKLIHQLGISDKVILTETCENITEILAAMDVFVLTSMWEGMPYALLEAMAMKKPVVASEIMGINEVVIHNETGYLVEPGNAEAFAERILELIGDPGKAAQMGEAGRHVIERRYTLRNQIDTLSILYETLTGKQRVNLAVR
jgi:glycosyltransferase involved in cell wall biosynthesis